MPGSWILPLSKPCNSTTSVAMPEPKTCPALGCRATNPNRVVPNRTFYFNLNKLCFLFLMFTVMSLKQQSGGHVEMWKQMNVFSQVAFSLQGKIFAPTRFATSRPGRDTYAGTKYRGLRCCDVHRSHVLPRTWCRHQSPSVWANCGDLPTSPPTPGSSTLP